jgi:hypothetical protein
LTLPFIQLNYVKYNKGKGYICGHVDALHAMPPATDLYTERIVEGLIKEIGCAGIISTVSRLDYDLNRIPNGKDDSGIIEYWNTIKDILHYLQILEYKNEKLISPYLHLSIHGMKDSNYGPFAIEVGTQNGRSCSLLVKKWFDEALNHYGKSLFPEINIIFDKKFKGNKSITFHRLGDKKNYRGYGHQFHSFQIELSLNLRQNYLNQIITLFSEIFTEFQSKFVTFDQY